MTERYFIMAVKKSNPIGTFFTILLVLAIAAVLYYGLVMATQAGPAAQEAAEKAEMYITPDSISNIKCIPYSMLSEPFKASINEDEYNAVLKKDAPDENTLELFKKLGGVVNEPQFLQGAAVYYCGTVENPVTGIIKIKGIEYKVTQAISFAPNVKNFEPEVIQWTVTVERLTYA